MVLLSNNQNNNTNEPVKNRWHKPFARREQHAHKGFQTHANTVGGGGVVLACLLAKGPQEPHNNNAAIDATHTPKQHARESDASVRRYGHACVCVSVQRESHHKAKNPTNWA